MDANLWISKSHRGKQIGVTLLCLAAGSVLFFSTDPSGQKLGLLLLLIGIAGGLVSSLE